MISDVYVESFSLWQHFDDARLKVINQSMQLNEDSIKVVIQGMQLNEDSIKVVSQSMQEIRQPIMSNSVV